MGLITVVIVAAISRLWRRLAAPAAGGSRAVGVLLCLALLALPGCGSRVKASVGGERLGADGVPPTPVGIEVDPTPAEAVPTATPVALLAQVLSPVVDDRLATSNGNPSELALTYLRDRLPGAQVEVTGADARLYPGESGVAHVISWRARRGDSEQTGTALVRGSGPLSYAVTEALTDSVDLGDLAIDVGAGSVSLEGFVRSDRPFRVGVTTHEPDADASVAPEVAATGQHEVANSALPGSWFHFVLRDDAQQPIVIAELTTFLDGTSAPTVSTLQGIRDGRLDGWVVDPGAGPSQNADDAQRTGVPRVIAQLGLTDRIDLGIDASSGLLQAEIGRNDRWVISRLPLEVEQQLRAGGELVIPGRRHELVRLTGGSSRPVSIDDAIPLDGFAPVWIVERGGVLYAGRRAAATRTPVLVRVDLATGETQRLAAPQGDTPVPLGWSVASAEQVDLMVNLRNQDPDLDDVDHIFTLPPDR